MGLSVVAVITKGKSYVPTKSMNLRLMIFPISPISPFNPPSPLPDNSQRRIDPWRASDFDRPEPRVIHVPRPTLFA